MNISLDINIWISVFFTLAIFSFLYKDNPVYKFAESVFIGVSAGYIFCVWIVDVLKPRVSESYNSGSYFIIIPLFLGFLLFLNLVPKYKKYSFIPIAIFVGIYAGVNLVSYVKTYIIDQVEASVVPFVVFEKGEIVWFDSLNNIIMFIGLASVMFYFYYTKKSKGLFGKIRNVGLIYLMVAFGAAFGYTIIARISLLIGRLNFILSDWLGIIK